MVALCSKTEDRENDKKCKSQIVQRNRDSHLEYVKGEERAFDIRKVLTDTFERKAMASQLYLRKNLLLMKFDASGGFLETHFLKFNKLARKLIFTGAT